VAAPNRRTSLVPLLVFAIVGFVLAAVATGVYFYDRATQPDRSTPTVTVQQFMAAVFLQNDTKGVEQFICDRWALDDAVSWTQGLADPEARVSWDTVVTIAESEDDARVTARVRFRYRDDVAPSGEQQWRFDLVDENGWRVCNVGRVSA